MISIVIPNLNGHAHLERLMPSLDAQTSRDFEIVLADNGSTDESAAFMESRGATIVRLGKNIGFAAACNAGAKAARGDAIFFLNNDTALDPRCIAILERTSNEHNGVGFFAPMMIRMNDRDVMDGAGDLLPPDGRPVKRAAALKTTMPLDADVLSPCGGAALWRRDLFQKLGGFDDDFFAYLEDVDLGLRATLLGERGMFVADAIVYHLGAGTQEGGSTDSQDAVRWIARNKIWLWAKCLPASSLVRHAPSLWLGLIKSAAHHTFRSGRGREFFSGTIEGISGISKMLSRRKKIMETRTVTDREVERWIKAASR